MIQKQPPTLVPLFSGLTQVDVFGHPLMQPRRLNGFVVQGPQGGVTYSCPHVRERLGHDACPQEAMPSRRKCFVVKLHLLFLTLIAREIAKMGQRRRR